MRKRKIKSSSKNNVNDIINKVIRGLRKELMASTKEPEPSSGVDNTRTEPVVEPMIKDEIVNTPKKRGRKKKVTEPIKGSDSLSVEDNIDYSKIKEPKNLKLTRARKAKNDEFYTRLCDVEKHYEKEKPNSYAVVYEGGNDDNTDDAETVPLTGDGDFRSTECIEYLKECDIVATNPPFSLLREFIDTLTKYSKNFVIVGDLNSITYKQVFPLILSNKVWSGYSHPKEFSTKFDGGDIRKFGNKMWFATLEIKKRYEDLILYKTYNPIDYPKYDNYDAINVDKVKDIPVDYDGIIGVPITFIDKYNPNQFEILGCTESEYKGASNGIWSESSGVGQALVNGKKKYQRLFIRRKHS